MLASPFVWIATGYLLGSIPFGLLLARANGVDIRSVGSGNIGATNVLRTGNKGLAAATLLLDAGKGFAAVWLARQSGAAEGVQAAAGFAAFIGHLFPIWLKFRGGKGVATMLGITLAAWWPLGVAALVVWAIAAGLTRYSSIGGMASALAAPAIGLSVWLWMGQMTDPDAPQYWLLAELTMAALLIWKHAENIARLRAGTESRIGSKG